MKFWLLAVTILAMGRSCAATAQTADDPNEGCILAPDPTVAGAYNFSWWGKGGRTYFVQQSDDLVNWTYVPLIESGADQVTGYGFTSTSNSFFLRLVYSDIPTDDPFAADFDGDGVSNWDELMQGTDPLSAPMDTSGLPIDWEIHYFGQTGVDPDGDDDGDGISNFMEYLAGTDPTDYYNGNPPYIQIVDGGDQQGDQGTVLGTPISVEVVSYGATIQTYNNAALTFSVTNGGALLSAQADQNAATSASITLNTTQQFVDQDGNTHQVAQVYVHLPSQDGNHSTITITTQAGKKIQTAQTTAVTTNPTLLPPSNFTVTPTSYSSVEADWVPSDTTKQTVIERSYDQGRSWQPILHVPAGQSSATVGNLISDFEVWLRAYTDDN